MVDEEEEKNVLQHQQQKEKLTQCCWQASFFPSKPYLKVNDV
jgi:hypothetical protein